MRDSDDDDGLGDVADENEKEMKSMHTFSTVAPRPVVCSGGTGRRRRCMAS